MLKRIFDIFFSLLGIIILLPVLLLTAILIKREDSGPVLYQGPRIGKRGKPFKLLKFRTMVVNADKLGDASTPEDDPRVTSTGKLLRKYKIDELPQLFNVLFGQMSLVGPRPQVAWAVDLYTPEEKLLLSVRPGITDYASLKFRNEAQILKGSLNPDKDYLEKIAPQKIKLGLEYVRNHSLRVDLKIIFLTLIAVFKRE
jgi:lipopolysaccharide/colanic/teichoic acid biosynthesis glycosyltransferase